MREYEFLESNIASFDFETTGFNAHKGAEYFAYSIGIPILNCDGYVEDCQVLVKRVDNKDKKLNKHNDDFLREFFKRKNKTRAIHNLKFELHFLDKHEIYYPKSTTFHDTMIMSQMLNNLGRSHTLDYICWLYADYPRDLDEQVKISAKSVGNNYQKINKKLMEKYQYADAERCLLIYFLYLKELEKTSEVYKCYLNEIELIKVTQKMEKQGMLLDLDNIYKLQNWLFNELEKVRDETFSLLGEYVNLNSDDTVSRLLYRKYKMPILKLTDTGKPATDKDTLAELRLISPNHKIFDLILKQRSYSDAVSKLKSYLKFGGENGRINPNINTNQARTGRQSSSGPNMQNVSKEAALKNLFPVPLRKAFRGEKGHILLLVDYSGIEMRLIIEATGENELMDMLLADRNSDMHHPTVECFLGRKEAALLKKENYKEYKIKRSAFKNTGFCIAYGGSNNKVAFTLMRPLDEIKDGADNYRKRFPRIDNFTTNIIEQVKRKGFIKTSFGRKLNVPKNKAYIGSNYQIQGTAAEVLKRGQVKVAQFIKKELNNHIKLHLPVHDELIMSYPRNLLSRKTEILTEMSRLLTDMSEIKVPLEVEWKMSTTDWNSAKEIKLTN